MKQHWQRPSDAPPPVRRTGYSDPGPLPGFGDQSQGKPEWLRQLDPSDLDPECFRWVEGDPPLPAPMVSQGSWSTREGWLANFQSTYPTSPIALQSSPEDLGKLNAYKHLKRLTPKPWAPNPGYSIHCISLSWLLGLTD